MRSDDTTPDPSARPGVPRPEARDRHQPAPAAGAADSGSSRQEFPLPVGPPGSPDLPQPNPTPAKDLFVAPPAVELPRGGGAIRGIGEKFQANPVTGTGSMSVPIAVSPGRDGFAPQLALSYDSGGGNGPFGHGWRVGVPSIRRKTDKGLPTYHDGSVDGSADQDTFVFSEAEDLVPLLVDNAGTWQPDTRVESGWRVVRYRPRVEGAFARIERWTSQTTGETYWKTVDAENTTRVYGQSANARLADPNDSSRVFEWLLQEVADEVGNLMRYEYKHEDRAGVTGSAPCERARQRSGVSYAYLKRVHYGNATPGTASNWKFEVVFDYGEHDAATPTPTEAQAWPVRSDPFSSFRAGFDQRCYRLCRRVLMFHRISDLSANPVLVRSTELTHDDSAHLTKLSEVVQRGWKPDGQGGYTTETMPRVAFGYSEAVVGQQVELVDGLDDLPESLDLSRWQWIDLDGEGLNGLLTEQGGAWFFKRNEGEGTLGAIQQLPSRPATSLSSGARLLDVDGDGRLDIVQIARPLAGYQQRDADGRWGRWRAFDQVPELDWSDPNVRVIDLNGDGHADLLVTEDEVLRWYPSEARDGYSRSRRVRKPDSEEDGPRLLFSSEGESIFLADMSGDGLVDLVRVRNRSICFWPNLGYGRFGAKITMAGAPAFDSPDRFDPGRVQLADVDGSGPSDLVYLGPDHVRVWRNESGNGFGSPDELTRLPGVDRARTVQVADLLGDGTACLVWSSPLLSDRMHALRYVRLMSQGKPHLLVHVDNGLGRETRLTYAPSTKFYLADRRAGTPWATRLPFPVQCLEKVEVVDHVTGWRFANTYAYHHGTFDGVDREFRGFGMVEQWDTESFADFDAATAAAAKGSVTETPTVRVTTYEVGPGAFTGTSYDLQLKQDLESDYFVMVEGLQDASPLRADNVGVRVTADPLGTGSLSASSGDDVIELSRGDDVDGDWVGTVTVVESLGSASTDGFTLVDVKTVTASSGGSGSQATSVSANSAWSDLDQVALYGGPRGGGSSVATGGQAAHNSLFGKLEPSSTDTITWTRHGGGVNLKAAAATVFVVEWGSNHRLERINVTGSTGSLGYDTASIPGSSVTRANTWLWASGSTADKDAGTSFLGLMVALGDGTTMNSTESSVAVGCKHATSRDVLITVHEHTGLSVDWQVKAEGDATEARHTWTVDAATSAETYDEVGPVKTTSGSRFALQTQSHVEDTNLELERVRFGLRAASDTEVVARRTETGGAWRAHLQVIDFGGLVSSTARTDPQVAHYVPPVRTRTWFHTGVFRLGVTLQEQYGAEYWSGDSSAAVLPDSALPSGLTAHDRIEAIRALKGKVLRTEVYADDGTADEDKPYQVTASRYEVRQLQDRADNRYGCYLAVPAETMTWSYERDASDPRVSHQLVLDVDDYGQVLEAAIAAYPRRTSNSNLGEQDALLITASTRDVIHDDSSASRYHIGVVYRQQTWEITGLSATDSSPLVPSTLKSDIDSASTRAYEADPGTGTEKRLVAETRTLYWNDGLTGAEALGSMGARALVYERYQLAAPHSWVSSAWNSNVTSTELSEGGYVQPDGTGTDWYAPSGRATLSSTAFYRPQSVTDPFGNATTITWDSHDLLVEELTDAAGNTVTATNDYRVLQPVTVEDANGHSRSVALDELGRVTKMAVIGRDGEGDTLSDPSQTVSYELDRWVDDGRPVRVTVQTRETHADSNTRWQEEVTYSDGGGNVVLAKAKAWPGEAPLRDANGDLVFVDGELVFDHSDTRWVGSGRVVVDNKGNPVQQYEPFFSTSEDYEDEVQLVEWGVSPLIQYDPLGRQVRVDHPDATFETVEFDAWSQTSSDRCDTVEDSDWYTARASSTDPLIERSVDQSTPHYGTSTTAYIDPMGRPFLTEETPDGTTLYETRQVLDILGRTVSVTDARDIETQTDDYDALGRSAHIASADAGDTWVLTDVSGQPIRTWKTGDVEVRQTYDDLRRPVGTYVTEGVASERLHVFNVYGELLVDSATQTDNDLADDNSLKGRLWRQYDGAGLVETVAYDFKGNVLQTERTFLDDVDTEVDWSSLTSQTTKATLDSNASSDLLTESWTTEQTYDALDRVDTRTTPDASVTAYTYLLPGLLETVSVQVRGDSTWTPMVRELDYNARGQRTHAVLAENDDGSDGAVRTAYTYDPETFRLVRLKTVRASDGKRLQDLLYTYDACGNIVQVTDSAQQTLFFDNTVVTPTRKYQYDGLYRLVSAEGREHGSLGQTGPDDPTMGDLPHDNDGSTVRSFYETYVYDAVGNITEMKHQLGTEASPGTTEWHRHYSYSSTSNQLLRTSIPADDPADPDNFSHVYTHNGRGAMTAMPHLTTMTRQFDDQLRSVDLGSGDDAVYHYDAGGQRVRKVVRLGANTEERLYLDGYEVYRKDVSSSLDTERETLHVMDDQRRVAMVETLTVDGGSTVSSPTPRQRLQLDDHLGSAVCEVDEDGALITYEEYHPYGSTSWWATASGVDVSQKRYRYTGMEKDEETGLARHGVRYYAPWLGRWASADPAGMVDGPNRYAYVRNNPVRGRDPTGSFTMPGLAAAYLIDRYLMPVAHAPTEPTTGPPTESDLAMAQARREVEMMRLPDGTLPSDEQIAAGELPERTWMMGSDATVTSTLPPGKANRVPLFEAVIAGSLPGAVVTALAPGPEDVAAVGLIGKAGRFSGDLVEQLPLAAKKAGVEGVEAVAGASKAVVSADPGILRRKLTAAAGGDLPTAAELRVAKLLRAEGRSVHLIDDMLTPGVTHDALVDGSLRVDVKRIAGLGRNAAGDLAKGVRQVGAGGEVIVVRPSSARQTLAQYEDFVGNFTPSESGVTFRVVDEASLPTLFYQR